MSHIISLPFCRLFKTRLKSEEYCLKGLDCKETTAARLSEKWNSYNQVWCKFYSERDINICPLCSRRSELSKNSRRRRGQRKACHATGLSTKEATDDSDTAAPHSPRGCDPADPATDTASSCSSPTPHVNDTLSSQSTSRSEIL